MCSVIDSLDSHGDRDDRTAKARIRDVAIEQFAARGIGGTSVRSIASAAGVSPALVIHHFGSKEGLRASCDEYVAAFIRRRKHRAARQGVGFDPLASLRESADGPPVASYLARTLVEGSAQTDELLDEMLADAVVYQQEMLDSGILQPSEDPRGRAAVLLIWSLGAVVLHDHVRRLLDADLTTRTAEPQRLAGYILPVLDILTHGVLTEAVYERARQAFSAEASRQRPA